MPTTRQSPLVTTFAIFVWFSTSSFLHGLVLIGLLYSALVAALPGYGSYIFLALLATYLMQIFLGKAEHTLSSSWPLFTRGFVPQAGLDYFGMRTLGAEELDAVKGERLLLGLGPHGVYPFAGMLTYASHSPLLEQHPWLRVHPAGASVMWKIPLIREYLLWTGHLDVSRRTLSRHMQAAEVDVAILPGGEKESLATRNGQELVVLEGRVGFVKLALKYGYHLVPTYAFGQNEAFTVSESFLAGPRKWLQRNFKMSIPVFWGRWLVMPHKVTISLAFGKVVRVPKPPPGFPDPDPAEVERVHAEYVRSLRAGFEKHKVAAGYPDRELIVSGVGDKKHR